MVLGIADDSTSNVLLDAELTALPSSGLYLNSGTHPSITVANLLAFLPLLDIVPDAWSGVKTYGVYSTSRKRSDLVLVSGVIYQSIKASNTNHVPDEANSAYWMATNQESLRLKTFIFRVKDKVLADLRLTKRLVNNQYLYENITEATAEVLLPNDYAAWVFEAKGSDYITFRINQASIAKSGTTPISLYVVNQGQLVDTLTITPSNGKTDFKPLDYTFSGTGLWKFVIDATQVYTENNVVDPLKYDGLVCYTATGTGSAPETAQYNYGCSGNGLGFNISAYLDSSVYIENNLSELGNFVRATFELMALQMFLHNSNNKSNAAQRIQEDRELLIAETKSLEMNSVAKRYTDEKRRVMRILDKTFDTQLCDSDDMEIEYSSI